MSYLKRVLKKNNAVYSNLCVARQRINELFAIPKYIKSDRIHLTKNRDDSTKYLIYSYEGQSGLMTQMICVLGWLRYAVMNGFILVVDMTSEYNAYYCTDKNSWELFFQQPMFSEQVDINQINIIKKTENYAVCPSAVRHNLRYEWLYQHISKIIKPTITFPLPRDYKARPQLQKEFMELYSKYIHLIPPVQEYVDKEYAELLCGKGRILGVLIRGTDYVQSKPFMHPIQPSIKQVITLIEKISANNKWDYIYLATEEKKVSDAIKECYPGKVIENHRTYYDGDYSHKWLYSVLKESNNDPFSSGLQYLSSIYLLSKCDMLVGGLCGGTQAALIMNGGKYERVDLFDNGDYGDK